MGSPLAAARGATMQLMALELQGPRLFPPELRGSPLFTILPSPPRISKTLQFHSGPRSRPRVGYKSRPREEIWRNSRQATRR
jgi:hypothetical protein